MFLQSTKRSWIGLLILVVLSAPPHSHPPLQTKKNNWIFFCEWEEGQRRGGAKRVGSSFPSSILWFKGFFFLVPFIGFRFQFIYLPHHPPPHTFKTEHPTTLPPKKKHTPLPLSTFAPKNHEEPRQGVFWLGKGEKGKGEVFWLGVSWGCAWWWMDGVGVFGGKKKRKRRSKLKGTGKIEKRVDPSSHKQKNCCVPTQVVKRGYLQRFFVRGGKG